MSKKSDKIIIIDWENFRNFIKNEIFKKCLSENLFHAETDTIGFTDNINIEKKPLSIPNIVSLIFIEKIINYYKFDKVLIIYKSSLYNEPVNFFFNKIYKGLLNRKKFIFFKIYIHNIQKSFDYKIINKNEYDILRGIDDYGCIMVYDYLKRKKFKNTTILTNDKRSFFDMLSFNKLLNTKKRNYIFKRSFKKWFD